MALNSGDALYTLLWKKLVFLDIEPDRLLALQKLYADSFKRVVDGQGIELSWIQSGRFDVSEKEYLEMIRGKTSALMGLSCEVGASIGGGGSGVCSIMRDYGEKIGTAFQIQDDVLNVTGDFEKYKKEIGGDITEGKRTLMVVHCLANAGDKEKERLISVLSSHSKKPEDIADAISILKDHGSIDYAQDFAKRLADEAKALLESLPSSEDKDSLNAIAGYVVTIQGAPTISS
jgi:geranylgeranyl diphosphate synthase type I